MKPLQRGMLALIALLLTPLIVFGQDENTLTAVGSGIVSPLVQAAAEASGAAVTVNVTGTNSGFTAFCRGEADLTTATRPISPEEEAACSTAGVSFVELLAGYNIITFVTNPADTAAQCLTQDQVRQAFAPSAAGQVLDWAQLGGEFTSQPLTLAIPAADTPAAAVLDALVSADGLRADATRPGDAAAIISAVSSTPGTLGVVPFDAAVAAGSSVKILQLSAGAAGCVAPTLENIDADLYGGAQRLFVYANTASLSKPGLTETLTYLTSGSAADAVTGAGFTTPSQASYDANAAALANPEGGRQFSGGTSGYTISNAVSGAVTVAGSAAGRDYFTALTGGFSSQYPGVTFTTTLEGEPDGVRRLCNGEVDIAVITMPLSDEQIGNCAANNIEVYNLALGSQAVTLLANASNANATCLSTSQLGTIWRASESAPTNWNQVDASFADLPLILVAPSTSDTTDLLLALTSDQPGVDRLPTETNSDPLYRGTAVGNVPGALSYFNWAELEQVTSSGQANVVPVSVRADAEGSTCVAPSVATIEDGSYPLSRPISLAINRTALNRPEVQGILWYAAQEANYSFIEDAGFIGLQLSELGDLRAELETTFAEVAAEAFIPSPESTAEATAEATPDGEGQLTEEAPTPEATAEATTEATAEATASS
jgi:ABC-type phosphate transport system substrate-binding protein